MFKQGKRPKRLRRVGSLSYLISAGCIVVALASLSIALRPETGESKQPAPVVTVAQDDVSLIPVPNRIVTKGERLSEVTFVEVPWPKSRLTDEFATDLAQLKNSSARTELGRLMPVMKSAVIQGAVVPNQFAESVPPGFRAIGVPVDQMSSYEGLLQPGSRVDVKLIRENRGSIDVRLIAEDVQVLAVGRAMETNPAEKPGTRGTPATVTLVVSQEQDLIISGAMRLGKIGFGLRNPTDKIGATKNYVTVENILGTSKKVETADLPPGVFRDQDGNTYVLGQGDRRWRESPEAEKLLPKWEKKVSLPVKVAPKLSSDDKVAAGASPKKDNNATSTTLPSPLNIAATIAATEVQGPKLPKVEEQNPEIKKPTSFNEEEKFR